MNNDFLAALDDLQRQYAQRLRTTKALQSGVGNAAKAIARLAQSLDDYGAQGLDLPPDDLSQVRDVIEQANVKENIAGLLSTPLRREAALYQKVIGAFRAASAALNSDPVDAVRLHKAYTTLEPLSEGREDLIALLPALADALQQAQEQLGSTFGLALREALADYDLTVEGRPPRFAVGRFEIVTDFASRKASIAYGKVEVARGIPLSLDRVVKAVLAQIRAIENRAEDGAAWIEQFYSAWSMVNLKQGRERGRVNIIDCYYEMVLRRQKRTFNNAPSKSAFTDYNRAEFAYDFARFVYDESAAHQGWRVKPHVATKSQAESASSSLWIVTGSGPHDGEYIGSIEFEAV